MLLKVAIEVFGLGVRFLEFLPDMVKNQRVFLPGDGHDRAEIIEAMLFREVIARLHAFVIANMASFPAFWLIFIRQKVLHIFLVVICRNDEFDVVSVVPFDIGD